MPIDALTALNAYKNQMKMMQDAATGGDDAQNSGAAEGSTFAQMVKDATQNAVDVEKQGEAHQIKSLTDGGAVDRLSDIVTSMSNAELTLNTVVAIRDRVINAYNDIIKMSI